MRILAIVVGVIVVAAIALVLAVRPSAEERKKFADASAAMRQAVLSRSIFKDAQHISKDGIRAVVYEWALGSGVATVIAYVDGTTSLYFSTGGGVIGAGAREPVKLANERLRAEATKVMPSFAPVAAFPLPTDGQSIFYVITDSATLSSGGVANSELSGGRHALSDLAQRAQEVITQIRKSS